jgi:hypothetical protein
MRAAVADTLARVAAAQRERQDASQNNEKWVRTHRLLRISEPAQAAPLVTAAAIRRIAPAGRARGLSARREFDGGRGQAIAQLSCETMPRRLLDGPAR